MQPSREQVYLLLGRLKHDPFNTTLEQEFYTVGIRFLISLTNSIALPSVMGHYWCQHTDLMQYLIKAFASQNELGSSYKDDQGKGWENFKRSANLQLSQCIQCLDKYYSIKATMCKDVEKTHESSTITTTTMTGLLDALATQDAQRLENSMKTYALSLENGASGATSGLVSEQQKLIMYAFYEVLSHPRLLKAESLWKNFCITINLMNIKKIKFNLKKALPGLMLCCYSPQRNVRDWTASIFKSWRESLEMNKATAHTIPSFTEAEQKETELWDWKEVWTEIKTVLESGQLDMKEDTREGAYLPIGPSHKPGIYNHYMMTISGKEFIRGLVITLTHVELPKEELSFWWRVFSSHLRLHTNVFWSALQGIFLLLQRFGNYIWTLYSPSAIMSAIEDHVEVFRAIGRDVHDYNLTLQLDRVKLHGSLLDCNPLMGCFLWAYEFLESCIGDRDFCQIFNRLISFFGVQLTRGYERNELIYIQSKWFAYSLPLALVSEKKLSKEDCRLYLLGVMGDMNCWDDFRLSLNGHPILLDLSTKWIELCCQMDLKSIFSTNSNSQDPWDSNKLYQYWMAISSYSPLDYSTEFHSLCLQYFLNQCFFHIPETKRKFKETIENYLITFMSSLNQMLPKNTYLEKIYTDSSYFEAYLSMLFHAEKPLRKIGENLLGFISHKDELTAQLSYFVHRAPVSTLQSLTRLLQKCCKLEPKPSNWDTILTKLLEITKGIFSCLFPSKNELEIERFDIPEQLTLFGQLFLWLWSFYFHSIRYFLANSKNSSSTLPLGEILKQTFRLLYVYSNEKWLQSLFKLKSNPDMLMFNDDGDWFPSLIQCYIWLSKKDIKMTNLCFELIEDLIYCWLSNRHIMSESSVQYMKLLAQTTGLLQPEKRTGFIKLLKNYQNTASQKIDFALGNEIKSDKTKVYVDLTREELIVKKMPIERTDSTIKHGGMTTSQSEKGYIRGLSKPASSVSKTPVPLVSKFGMSSVNKFQKMKMEFLKETKPTATLRIAHSSGGTTVPVSSSDEDELNSSDKISSKLFSSTQERTKEYNDDIMVAKKRRQRPATVEISAGNVRSLQSKKVKLIDDPKLVVKNKQGTRLLSSGSMPTPLSHSKPYNGPVLDIHHLYRRILALDLESEKEDGEFLSVPAIFPDYEHYVRVFEPLLLLETKAQIIRAKEEASLGNTDTAIVTLDSVTMINDFHELSFTFNEWSSKGKEDSTPFIENDYVVLDATSSATNNKSMNGIVTGSCVKLGEFHFNLKVWIDTNPMQRAILFELREKSTWKALKLCNLVTVVREFGALAGLPKCAHLLPYILNPSLLRPLLTTVGTEESPQENGHLRELMEFFNLNHSQANAVHAVIHSSCPFALIQGPPGTGKTTTILSLLSYHLSMMASSRSGLSHSRVAHLMASMPQASKERDKKTILVCAPSNAAVDEIVRRIVSGLPNYANRNERIIGFLQLNVVRVGALEMIHDSVRKYALDSLVEEELNTWKAFQGYSSQSGPKEDDTLGKLYSEMNAIKQALDDAEHDTNAMTSKAELMVKKREIIAKIEAAKGEKSKIGKSLEEARAGFRMGLLQKADVICCTLSGSGHELLFNAGLVFETIIIDEACQCVELSSLIPLRLGAQKIVLVGDPNQLPPTVISQFSMAYSYEQSLFSRIQTVLGQSAVFLLAVQYRMHPEICAFPSAYFYQGRLTNGPLVLSDNQREWHVRGGPYLRPFLFFDVLGMESSTISKSFINTKEIEMMIHLLKFLCFSAPTTYFSGKIGLITPYKQQMKEIKRALIKAFNNKILKHVDVNTIDGFQGQEKDVILFSCVRSGSFVDPSISSSERRKDNIKTQTNSIGFLSDMRRLNVALTRAKSSLWMFGNASALAHSGVSIWEELISFVKNKECLVQLKSAPWKALNALHPTNLFAVPSSTNFSHLPQELTSLISSANNLHHSDKNESNSLSRKMKQTSSVSSSYEKGDSSKYKNPQNKNLPLENSHEKSRYDPMHKNNDRVKTEEYERKENKSVGQFVPLSQSSKMEKDLMVKASSTESRHHLPGAHHSETIFRATAATPSAPRTGLSGAIVDPRRGKPSVMESSALPPS